jgi:N-acetylglutamate synthase-like GNAT family acetyltransferase
MCDHGVTAGRPEKSKIRVKKILLIERFPALQGETICLRLCRARDFACLRILFEGAASPIPGSGQRTFRSLPSFVKWLLLTFQVIYLIEAEKTTLGFVGLYNMKPAKRLKLSIMMFNPHDRGKGHGRDALELLLTYLQKKGLAEEVVAEVASTNMLSLSFFERAGFEIVEQKDGLIVLSKKLSSSAIS